MQAFIRAQIDNFGGQMFDIDSMREVLADEPFVFFLYIRNNQLIYDSCPHSRLQMHRDRRMRIIELVQLAADLRALPDTDLVFNTCDSCIDVPVPVFNMVAPLGRAALIYPNFDTMHFYIDDTRTESFDTVKRLIRSFAPPPKKIVNDIFFIGGSTSFRRSRIRESFERFRAPFNVKILRDPAHHQHIRLIKTHKYLLDLPGNKPWSVRFKYLMCAERVVFRISLFDPARGETGFHLQPYDYVFTENVDYVHLVYPANYDQPLSADLLAQIRGDILIHKAYFDEHPREYSAMVARAAAKVSQLSEYKFLLYFNNLIREYTERLFVSNESGNTDRLFAPQE